MKIYDMPGFPSPLRVRVALAEKGLASRVEFIRVDVPAAEHKQKAFLEKNPTGTVPVLELDDGTCLAECTAITEYLDNLDGKPTLTGTTPKEKGVIHMMQKRADDQLIDAIGIYFHHATEGLGPQLKPYKSPEWQERAVWGERNREKALNGMRYFDQVLQTRPYVAGDQFSMADITVWAGLVFAGFAQIAIPEECTALAAWNARVSERPSVKKPA
ncbi:glutathione S-transferase [Pseudomonas gingeri]|uniref:glutathione S-transferase family protein n=1 Tax=Pseudomonas gingeri TaxID=117681 RepID=UPI00159F7DA7|nr:glutathione S-transferase [Pseudomonas gingeri]NVZ24516.1 glutathione S-transferase [Pseudomonas gingeri]